MPTKLGQNFLINENIAKKMAQSANLTPSDFVLEIGPGKGILTEELAKHVGKIVAIEIDGNLAEILKNKFRDRENVEIIQGDILKINLKNILGNEAYKYKVVANLPYYITSPIIRLFLESEIPPSEMILMVQKEVAERIAAKAGKMSILAVSVQYYARMEILFKVGKKDFNPVPEVDSAVIRITPHPGSLPERDEGDFNRKFFRIVRAGFCAKRKTLANNLANSFHLDKKIVDEKLGSLKIKNTARAQELSVDNWKKLASIF